MIKILFICHGNICRSTMAQFVFQNLVNTRGLSGCFYIDSAATSTEEIGSGPHYGTVRKMQEVGIPVLPHRAVQLTRADYEKYDYILGMDHWNLKNMRRILKADPEGKLALLLDFTDNPGEIADPWYTGNFDVTYADVKRGCEGLLAHILERDRERLYKERV